MANEITLQLSLVAAKNGQSVNSGTQSETITMVGDDMGGIPQNITQAADVQLDIPAAVAVPYYLLLKNLDAANFIELSTGTGGSFAAGVFAKVPFGRRVLELPSTATIYAKADTADVKVQFHVCEL